jgi:ligand-binding SRPBCC domain-containing protein
MTVQTFEHSTFIRAAPEICSELFFEPVNFIKLNPLVAEVLDVKPGETEQGQPFCTFYVIDKIPIVGALTVPFKYCVRMTKSCDEMKVKQIISETRSFPNVQLRNVVTFTVQNGGTQVHESVTIETNPLLVGFSLQQAKQAHRALLANLKSVAEHPNAHSHPTGAESIRHS